MMWGTTEDRIQELKEIIANAEQEIYRLEWARDTAYKPRATNPCDGCSCDTMCMHVGRL